MAIIREKQSFQIGTIGVARASEAGRITGQAISQSANQIGTMLFEKAADEAEKAGLESGQSVDREQVIAINPQTGEPEAYDPPEGMGTIAADAYQRVVMTRFQRSIEDEIQNKARELAVRYENSSNGVALYTEAMSEYLSSMTNVAQDEFKGYINDVGTSYLNSTRTSMAAAQLRRERAAARRSQAAAVNEGLNNVFTAFAQGGPNALSGNEDNPTLADVVNAGVEAAINDGGESGLFNSEEVANYTADQRVAAITGLVTYYARQEGTDPDELDKMRLAIGLGNAAAIPAEFAGVAELYQGISTDRRSMGRVDNFSNGILSDSIRYNQILQREEQERLDEEARLRIFVGGQALPARAATEERLARTGLIPAVVDRAILAWDESQALMQGYVANSDTASLDFEGQRQTALISATAEGLFSRALVNLDPAGVIELQEAMQISNFDLAPTNESRAVLRALSALEEKTGIPFLEQFEAVANSYGSNGAQAVQMREESAALEELQEAINLDNIAFAENPDEAANAALARLAEINNLPPGAISGTQDQINYAAATAFVNQFFSDSNLTERQLDQLSTGVQAGPVPSGVFSDAQTSLLENIYRYAQASGDSSGIEGMVGDFVQGRKRDIEARAEERGAQVLRFEILNGGGNPNSSDDRLVAHEAALEGLNIDFPVTPQAFSNPAFLSSPEGQQYLNNARSMNVMPEPLYLAMIQFDNGQFTGDIGAFNDVIRNFETITNRGQIMTSPAFRALPPEAQVTLSYFADLSETLGTEDQTALAQAYLQYQEYEDNPLARQRLNQTLGLKADDEIFDYVYTINEGAWFSEGMDEAPLSAANNLVAMTLRLGALGLNEADIRTRLEEQLDRTYPESDVVRNANGGVRTIHALEITENITGFEDMFKRFVVDEVERSNPNGPAVSLGNIMNVPPPLVLGPVSEEQLDVRRIFLRALPQSAGSDVRYTVHTITPEGMQEEILKDYTIFEPDPRGAEEAAVAETFTAPLIVSNTDPVFLRLRQSAIDAQNARYEAAGARAVAERTAPLATFDRPYLDEYSGFVPPEVEAGETDLGIAPTVGGGEERGPASRERANRVVLESKESLFGRFLEPIINPQWLRDME